MGGDSEFPGGAAGRFLLEAERTLRPSLAADGELVDPVLGEPTQYGTAYYASLNAALFLLGRDPGHADAAEAALAAALAHLADGSRRPAASSFSGDVGSRAYANHRDFMWPAVLRAVALLASAGRDVSAARAQVRSVPAPEVFAARPPSNWAAVWILGEQLRMAEGLSPYRPEMLDRWLAPFFGEAPEEARLDVEAGFYKEPGLPNSYDLFTRLHLLELVEAGYAGHYRDELERLVRTGGRRSLAVQLSSGSLASAHRSTGQLWTLAGEVRFFHALARRLAADDPSAAAAARAAERAFSAISACQRPDGSASAVENVLPSAFRVGYERYTMDAHYVSLGLSFLAAAVVDGFEPGGATGDDRAPRGLVEGSPVHRSLLHADGWSLHVDLDPKPGYDALGIADLTPGVDRLLRFGGQVHYGRAGTEEGRGRGAGLRRGTGHGLWPGTPLALGVAIAGEDGAVAPLSAMTPRGGRRARVTGRLLEAGADVGAGRYHLAAEIDGDAVRVEEGVGGAQLSLLVPYLRDRGDSRSTSVAFDGRALSLMLGTESLAVVPARRVTRMVHLPYGYESRHGLCGLVRLDVEGDGPLPYLVRRR